MLGELTGGLCRSQQRALELEIFILASVTSLAQILGRELEGAVAPSL